MKNRTMLTILLATSHPENFEALQAELAALQPVDVEQALDSRSALDLAGRRPIDLAIVDEHVDDMPGLELVRRLLAVNAMINTALVSSAPAEVFHERTEGLGIMAPLPENCGAKEAALLMGILRKLTGLPGR